MAFTPRPLAVPNMRTDYSAENSAFANLGQTLGNLPGDIRKEQLQQQKQQLLGSLNSGNPDYAKVGMGLVALGDTQGGAALIGLGQKQQQLGAQQGFDRLIQGGSSTSSLPVSIGTPNEVENGFVSGVQKAGLTNPIGLGAVAAYGKAESGYSPTNVNRTWNDPSESGQAGQAGGIMSWRADRLQNLQRFAVGRGEQGNGSPETQAAFLAQEDPDLIPRLNAAKTPQEANQIMANAWRFAGYDREGGENARRGNLTAQYAQRYGSQGAPAQTAARPVQVAENEADVQRLEAQQGNPISVSPAPTQVAQADMPAPNAAPVTGPGTTQAAQAQGYAVPGTSLPPNDPVPHLSTKQVMSIIASPLASEGQRAQMKMVYDARQKYTDENAPDKREQQRLTTEKLRREVEGEGGRPMTDSERKAYGVREGQPAFIKKNGDPGFGPAGTSITNANTFDGKGESKFNEALGTAQAKRWNGYIEEGDVAQGRIADIQTLRDASRRLGSQGSSANMKATIGPYAESLGIKIDGLDDIQLYESITNRLAPTLRPPGSGSTSDIEFKGFQRAIGPLSNTPAAREMILDTFEAASRNDLARSEIASRLAEGQINRGQAEKEIRALPNPMEGFKKFREANPDLVGQALKDAARTQYEQKNAPPMVNSEDSYGKLKTGDRYTDAAGNVRVKR